MKRLLLSLPDRAKLASGSGLLVLPVFQTGSATKVQDLMNTDKGVRQCLVGTRSLPHEIELASGSDLLNLPHDSEDEAVLVLLQNRTFNSAYALAQLFLQSSILLAA